MPRSPHQHVAIGAVAALLLAMAVLLPAGALSFLSELQHSNSSQAFTLMPAPQAQTSPAGTLQLQVVLAGLVPWDGVVGLRISGHRSCIATCEPSLRLLLVAIPHAGDNALAQPVVMTLNLAPGDVDVYRELTLPVSGSWLDYPRDQYRLVLGVIEQRVGADGATAQVPAEEARSELGLTLEEHLTGISMSQPAQLAPNTVAQVAPGETYVLVSDIILRRALYDQAISSAVVLLAVSAAIYGVFMRPFRELVIGATGLALSLWGVRSLLLGNSPGITAVDVLLIGIIVFVLSGITVRLFISLLHDQPNP